MRDDDTNATTPVERLERLYAPYLDRGMAVNLAVIPEVSTDARRSDGTTEGFVQSPTREGCLPMASADALCRYLRERRFGICQHGLSHERIGGRPEFDLNDRVEVARRMACGRQRLREAGLDTASTFVAPYDLLSPEAFDEAARRFRAISTGWYEWRRLPRQWFSAYLKRKLLRRPHWRLGNGVLLLSHAGCILSRDHPYKGMAARVIDTVCKQRITVLVTHWWEYFNNGVADRAFVEILHEVADHFAKRSDIRVISFEELCSL